MIDGVQESDLELLTTLRATVDDIERPTPVGHVMARGQRLRRHRRLTKAASGVLLAMAVTVVAVKLPAGPESPAGRPSTAPLQRIDVELAGWSVRFNPDSSLTITLRDPHLFDFQHPQLVDADRLRSTLAGVGVPIVFEFHDLTAAKSDVLVDCHDTLDDLDRRVVVNDPEHAVGPDGHSWVITIRLANLPHGAVLKLLLMPIRTTITSKS